MVVRCQLGSVDFTDEARCRLGMASHALSLTGTGLNLAPFQRAGFPRRPHLTQRCSLGFGATPGRQPTPSKSSIGPSNAEVCILPAPDDGADLCSYDEQDGEGARRIYVGRILEIQGRQHELT
jgi:hypothetical protein